MTFLRTTIRDSVATDYGGALASQELGAMVTVEAFVLTGNQADEGGAAARGQRVEALRWASQAVALTREPGAGVGVTRVQARVAEALGPLRTAGSSAETLLDELGTQERDAQKARARAGATHVARLAQLFAPDPD